MSNVEESREAAEQVEEEDDEPDEWYGRRFGSPNSKLQLTIAGTRGFSVQVAPVHNKLHARLRHRIA